MEKNLINKFGSAILYCYKQFAYFGLACPTAFRKIKEDSKSRVGLKLYDDPETGQPVYESNWESMQRTDIFRKFIRKDITESEANKRIKKLNQETPLTGREYMENLSTKELLSYAIAGYPIGVAVTALMYGLINNVAQYNEMTQKIIESFHETSMKFAILLSIPVITNGLSFICEHLRSNKNKERLKIGTQVLEQILE